MLSQLMVLFGFFALVLVGVYWVNQALQLFDRLIGSGQTAMVFLELSVLTLPNVIRLVLPVAAFAAAVFVANRLTSESELVVMQATGFSAWRLARPVLYFGGVVAVLLAILMNVLVPASRTELNLRSAEIAENITARFLVEGAFLHPADGITLYIREITPEGELHDIFLADARSATQQTTYTAKRALLVRDDSGPKLVMLDGLAQTLRVDGQRMFTTGFSDFSYDIGALMTDAGAQRRSVDEVSTWQLLHPTEALLAETHETQAVFLYEGHTRLAQPLVAIAVALLGFSALLIGGFSRFGLWRQIMAAVVLLIVTQLLNNAAASIGSSDARYWGLAYGPALFGGLAAAGMLWLAGRPRRRPAVSPLTSGDEAAA